MPKIVMHEMKLEKTSFEKMSAGERTLELRLQDEKRKLLALGDQIMFKLYPTLDHQCVMEVIGLLHYPDFNSLISDIDMMWLGYGEEKREWIKTAMYNIYTPEEEKENGVLGIRLRKVTK